MTTNDSARVEFESTRCARCRPAYRSGPGDLPNPAELFEALEGALNDPRPRRGEPAPEWDGVGLPPSGGVDPATFWARKEK